jgi:hypothetical protein
MCKNPPPPPILFFLDDIFLTLTSTVPTHLATLLINYHTYLNLKITYQLTINSSSYSLTLIKYICGQKIYLLLAKLLSLDKTFILVN